MPLRVIASEPGFQPLRDSDNEDVPEEAEIRRVRYVRNLGAGVTVVYQKVKSFRRIFFWGGFSIGVLAAIAFIIWLIRNPGGHSLLCGPNRNYGDIVHYSKETKNLIAVNLGGWLCVEDWFFSGTVGRFVNTPDHLSQGQGACLPPKVTGPLEHPWGSEGNLVKSLIEHENFGRAGAAEALKAHRESYITTTDFQKIALLGIKTVRIPMSWIVFADALKDVSPEHYEVYGRHDPDHDTVVVPDPYYYNESFLVTVPRAWLKDRLQEAADAGLRVVLDLHNMPGGAQLRTYNGVWPLKPQFWQGSSRLSNTTDVKLVKLGTLIIEKLISWMESLTDLLGAGAIWGVTLLNDPGHGLVELGGAEVHSILDFVEVYTDRFRKSSLINYGVRLYVQLIQDAFVDFDTEAAKWWRTKLTKEERESWAVMGRHFYTAWRTQGAITPGENYAYQCDQDLATINETLRDAIGKYAYDFARLFEGNKAITEFSLGTHWDSDLSCQNNAVLRLLFERTIEAFAQLEESEDYRWRGDDPIEPMFWTWRVPFAPKFQAAWSLKYFSGLGNEEQLNGVCVVGKWAMLDPRRRWTNVTAEKESHSEF